MTIHAFDTEFIDDGHTIELISIGIVCEDGREYYAVNRDMPVRRIRKHRWLMDNVVPSLPKAYGDRRMTMPKRWLFDYAHPSVKKRDHIAKDVRRFLLANGKPELYADFCAYDRVVLAQLWGPMIALPEGIPIHMSSECAKSRRTSSHIRPIWRPQMATDYVTSFAGRKRHILGPSGSIVCGGHACEMGDLLKSGQRATRALIDALPLCRACAKAATP
jgi:hypothetical protein